jgi:uroporphyrinogen decarboxylase
MTPKERMLKAYNRQEPDRVPINIGGVAQKIANKTYQKVKEQLKIFDTNDRENQLDELGSIIHYHPKVLEYFGADNREIHINRLPPRQVFDDGSWENEFGIKMVYNEDSDTNYFVSHPLRDASIADIKAYDWPDPKDPKRFKGLKAEAKMLAETTDFAICAYKATVAGIFDCACFMRGMDRFLLDTLAEKELANVLLDKITEYNYNVYENFLNEVGEYVEVVQFNDDMGSQTNLLFRPDSYRELLKPRHKLLVDMFKQKAPNAKILLHCCGSVDKLIPDFIEIGIDILNPVQPKATNMDTYQLKKEFGNEICFQGGIDVQEALQGSVQDVETEVKERIKSLAPGGGYVLSTANNIDSKTPIDNVFALYKFAKKYGTYPLQQ